MAKRGVRSSKALNWKLVSLIVVILVIVALLVIFASVSKPNIAHINAVNFNEIVNGQTIQSSTNATNYSVVAGKNLSISIWIANNVVPASSCSLNSISFNDGFALLSISPSLPINIQSGSRISFDMNILTPQNGYSGILTINEYETC